MKHLLLLTAVLLAGCETPIPVVAPLMPVPSVGCETDGQQGRQPAPDTLDKHETLYTPAQDLAWYQSQELGVLAPRGWHCFALSGSNGGALFVTPEPHGEDLFKDDQPLTGPIVISRYSLSGTSGRFEVARMAARLFPSRKAFVEGVLAEEGVDRKDYPFGPWKTDKLTRPWPMGVRVVTPAGKAGAAVADRMGPGDLPAEGLIYMDAEDDLYAVSVRLPADKAGLADAILFDAENSANHDH